MNKSVSALAASSAVAVDVVVRRYTGRAGLETLRAAWDELAHSLSSPRFFQLSGWYDAVLSALEPEPDSVHFFALYRGAELAAVVPLKAATRALHGVPLRWLEMPRHPHIDLCDACCATGPAGAGLLDALLKHLHAQRELRWDVLLLPLLPQDGALAPALATAMPSRRVIVTRGASRYVPVESPEALSARISGSFRRNLRRLARRAQESGELRHRVYRGATELAEAMPAFLEVEASGWKGQSGEHSAIRLHPELCAFYERLHTSCAPAGECSIHLLWLGEECIAAQFGLRTAAGLSLLKIAYRESRAALAPGNLLMERVLDEFARAGVANVSFVTDPPWAHLWRAASVAVSDHYIFSGGARAGLAAMLLRLRRCLVERLRRRAVAAVPESETETEREER